MRGAAELQQIALRFGIERVGVAKAVPIKGRYVTPQCPTWLKRTWKMRFEPHLLLPGARAVICCAVKQPVPFLRAKERVRVVDHISRHALGRDYHIVVKERLFKFWEGIGERNFRCRVCVDSAPVAEKCYAVQAGLGWMGKNTLLVTDGGSFYHLGLILTDMPIEETPRVDAGCGSCNACIEACPTGAIVKPYVLDIERCLSYWTIEARGEIPLHLREKVFSVYGCDVCQDACPFNQDYKAAEGEAMLSFLDLDLVGLLYLSEEEAARHFSGTVFERLGLNRLKRNACVVIGNVRPKGAKEALAHVLSSGDELVKVHARWAMDRL